MTTSAPTFFCFEDPAESDDRTTDASRRQLRSWYHWIDNAPAGAANIEIACRPSSPPPVIAKHMKAAAEELQDSINQRAAEEARRDWPPPKPSSKRYRLIRDTQS